MSTQMATRKSHTAREEQAPAKPATTPRRRAARESAAQALNSGRAAANALNDTASQAGSAAAAVATDLRDLVAEASQNTLAINPLIGLSPRDVAGAPKSLPKVMSKAPGKTSTHYGHYLKELATVVKGKSELAPDPKDRRFADPAWKSNALYTRLMRTSGCVVVCDGGQNLVGSALFNIGAAQALEAHAKGLTAEEQKEPMR